MSELLSTDGDLTPRQGKERYLSHREGFVSEESLQTYHYRLKKFVKWCEEKGVETLDELTGRHMDAYEHHRRQQGIAKTTLKGDMKDLRTAVKYWEQIEAVDDGLHEKIPVRYPDKREEVSDDVLPWEDVKPLLAYYSRENHAGSRHHALLELAWNTGARVSALRALDLRDFHPDDGIVWFRHRPGSGTALKKGLDSERVVSIPPRVVAAVETYREENRKRVRDDEGRAPLFTSQQGRPVKNTIRQWFYRLTRPCMYGQCPHGRDLDDCEARTRQHESHCPSSKSPHPVRKGSISWHLANGVPQSVVEHRCDASAEVIQRHYDMRSPKQKAENRRDTVLPNLTYV